MLRAKKYIVYISAFSLFLLTLFFNQQVLALDIPDIPTIPQWKPAEVNIEIPTIPPLPTIPPMPTLGWHCDCTPTPGQPTPTPSNQPTPTPTAPPGGGGGNGGGSTSSGGGASSSSGGGGQVLGATTYAPTGTFSESLTYLSLILGLLLIAKSITASYGKKLFSLFQ